MPWNAADEVPRPNGCKWDDIFAGQERRDGAGAVAGVVPSLSHLHHIVHGGGVLKLQLIADGEPGSRSPHGVVGLQVP